MSEVHDVAGPIPGVLEHGQRSSAHNLGVALSQRGRRVLLVDIDPQGCLTFALGLDPDALPTTLHDVLLGRTTAAEVLVNVNGVGLLPSSIDLAGSELHLLGRTGREHAGASARRQSARTP